ncbi:MAG: hypothetical protein JWM68_4345 [Verrucomicrobiales bacterium]|nr:hypothetical protein [Verrucomicrobiales bacterium]
MQNFAFPKLRSLSGAKIGTFEAAAAFRHVKLSFSEAAEGVRHAKLCLPEAARGVLHVKLVISEAAALNVYKGFELFRALSTPEILGKAIPWSARQVEGFWPAGE